MKKIVSPIRLITILAAFGAFAAPEVKAQSFWDYFFRRSNPSPPKPAVSKFDLKKEVYALDRMSGELLTSYRKDIQTNHKGPDAHGHKGKGSNRVNPKQQLMLQQLTDYNSKVDTLVLATNKPHGIDNHLVKKSLGVICASLETIQKIQPEIRTSPVTDALIKRNSVLAYKVNKEAALIKPPRPVIKHDAIALDRLAGELITSYRNDIRSIGQKGKGHGGQYGHSKGGGKGKAKREYFMQQLVDYNTQVDKLVVATGYPTSTKYSTLKKAMHGICVTLAAVEKSQTEVRISETTSALIKRNSLLANKVNKVTERY